MPLAVQLTGRPAGIRIGLRARTVADREPLGRPLLIALAVIIAGAAATYRLGKPDPAWVRAPGGQSR